MSKTVYLVKLKKQHSTQPVLEMSTI